MIGLKRLIRPGVVISGLAHVSAVAVGLLAGGALPWKSVPPEAMVVEIVRPDEAPRLEGAPADARTSGSTAPSSNGTSAVAKPAPTESPAQPQQQRRQASHPDRNVRQATAQSQPVLPEAAQAEMPKLPAAEPNSSPAEPRPEEEPDRPGATEMLAQMALVGGKFGGGFAAPAIDTTWSEYDFTAPFRERVSSCSVLPPGIDAGDKINVPIRVSFNPDGTLAAPPKPIVPITSWKQQALLESATNALQQCQPYTMLPAAKYKQWKTLSLVIAPLSFGGK